MDRKYYNILIFRSITKSGWLPMPAKVKEKLLNAFVNNGKKDDVLTYYSDTPVAPGKIVNVSIKNNGEVIGIVQGENHKLNEDINYRSIDEVLE